MHPVTVEIKISAHYNWKVYKHFYASYLLIQFDASYSLIVFANITIDFHYFHLFIDSTEDTLIFFYHSFYVC